MLIDDVMLYVVEIGRRQSWYWTGRTTPKSHLGRCQHDWRYYRYYSASGPARCCPALS